MMISNKTLALMKIALSILLIASAGCSSITQKSKTIKLYALDCGALEVADASFFSDDGKLNGRSLSLANPCFLIQHDLSHFNALPLFPAFLD